jgi:hypothetical protein
VVLGSGSLARIQVSSANVAKIELGWVGMSAVYTLCRSFNRDVSGEHLDVP